jgi:hypothetical protein
VLRAMRSIHFDAAGVSRSYLDFYLGFGFINSIYLLTQAVVFWQLASVASAFLSWTFIFLVPVALFAAIAVCLGPAFHAAGRAKGL